jgi:hypothetical protein
MVSAMQSLEQGKELRLSASPSTFGVDKQESKSGDFRFSGLQTFHRLWLIYRVPQNCESRHVFPFMGKGSAPARMKEKHCTTRFERETANSEALWKAGSPHLIFSSNPSFPIELTGFSTFRGCAPVPVCGRIAAYENEDIQQ